MLVDNLLGMPNGLAVDIETNELCWADGGAPKMAHRERVMPKLGIYGKCCKFI